jgi:enterochelin esterase-like enzyme
VFEPQGAGFFLLLMVVFGGLLVWVALARQLVFRVLAACLAFLPAMVFGVAAVNRYYDYYQTWGGMINDLTSQGAGNLPKYAAGGTGTNKQFDKNIGRVTSQAEDAQVGYLFQTSVAGAHSHLTRDVLVYLPPQYFQKRFRHYKFPVIELLHGSPGGPRAWVDVMGVIPTFLSLLATRPQDAAVLVMPDTDGSPRYGLQCLNNPGGIQDMTFVARDVPDAIARIARVQPPGRPWGLAGYSEGGYCAANIGVQDPKGYGAVGVLSGYFAPIKSQVPAGNKPGGRLLTVNVFLGHPGLKLVNTPRYYVTRVPVNDELPAFWLAVGAQDREDVLAAQDFRQVLQTRMVYVPLMMVPGGGHQASVWRAALGPMLSWMTRPLASAAKQADATAARTAAARAAGARAAAARKPHHGKPRPPHAATVSRKP